MENGTKPVVCSTCNCVVGPEGIHFSTNTCVKRLRVTLDHLSRGMSDAAVEYGRKITDQDETLRRYRNTLWLALRRLPKGPVHFSMAEVKAIPKTANVSMVMSEDKTQITFEALVDLPKEPTKGSA